VSVSNTERGVIFDFDGVLVHTDHLHYRAWQKLAEAEGLPFNRQISERLRGLGRMASLEILLGPTDRTFSHQEKLALADRKNTAYLELAESLTREDVLPGVWPLLTELTRRGVKVAVASSSRNTRAAMERVGLAGRFDVVVDGNDVRQTKPDPEVFLLAARRMGLPIEQCVVIEDAPAGIEAARRAGMAVLGVGTRETLGAVEHVAASLTVVTVDGLLAIGRH